MVLAVFDVAIIGGGIAGLAAAYELSQRGVSFVVLERAPRIGGVVLSEEVDGFTIDSGPDALLIQKPEAIALCHELGLGDRLVPTKPPRLAYIQRAGKLHALPAASVLGIPDRKSTRLNSSHANISYAVFCLKKKKKTNPANYHYKKKKKTNKK